MKKFFLQVEETPIPQARPRFSYRGTYNIQHQQKLRWKRVFVEKWPYLPCVEKIEMHCTFVLPYPISLSKRQKKAIENDPSSTPHIKKPDLSNLIKFVEDCMEGIIFENDKQIVEIQAKKCYRENGSFNCMIHTFEELKPINAF